MLNYIARRILITIPVLIGVTIISFYIITLAPGSPADMLIDPNLTAEDLALRKAVLGLDAPLHTQYINWLTNILQGNLGYSLTTFRPVSEMIGERIGPTLLLMGTALSVGLIIAMILGVLSATKQYSFLDYLSTTGAFFGISIPSFFLGLGLIYIFALQLKWVPSGGMFTLGGDESLGDRIAHLILPALVVGASIAGRIMRYVRSSMLEILGQDFLRTARAKGLQEFLVINRHALRNALIPIVTVVSLEIPGLLAGAIITEQVFSWPGLGRLTVSSILSRDYPTLMALNLLSAVMVIFANLFSDVIYSVVDPRIKYE